VKLNKTATETFNLLREAYVQNTLSRARVFEWHKRRSEERENVEDEEKDGRPLRKQSDENAVEISTVVRTDGLGIRMTSDELHMDNEVVRLIVTTNLNMKNCVPKWYQRICHFLAGKQNTNA
jgi:hypothetical protein